MKNLKKGKNNLISKTRKPAIFYTHTHVILKREKINETNAIFAFINNTS